MTIRLGKLLISVCWSPRPIPDAPADMPAACAQRAAGAPPTPPLVKVGPGGVYRRAFSGAEPIGEIVDRLV